MQRFFFNLSDGSVERDDVGMELTNIAAARVEAVRYTGEVLRGRPDMVSASREVRVEVTNERGLLLFTVIVIGINAPAMDGSSMVL